MRASATLVGKALAEVAGHIAPGVATSALDAVAEAYLTGHGGKPAFKGYRVGPRTFPATLCISVNEQVVHGIPGDYRLQDGDLVSVDCGVQLKGFFGDSAYTFGVGQVPDDRVALCRATYESLQNGIQAATAGNRVGDISHAVQSHCEAHGYGVVRDLVGHGIGRHLHEDPQIPNYGRRGTGRKLKEGMTLCIEPMINAGTHEVTTDADGWTIVTSDALPSAHYEHMVVVRRGEAEILSTFAFIEAVVDAPYTIELTNG